MELNPPTSNGEIVLTIKFNHMKLLFEKYESWKNESHMLFFQEGYILWLSTKQDAP